MRHPDSHAAASALADANRTSTCARCCSIRHAHSFTRLSTCSCISVSESGMCDGLKLTSSAPVYAPELLAAVSSAAALETSSSDVAARGARLGGRDSRSCMRIWSDEVKLDVVQGKWRCTACHAGKTGTAAPHLSVCEAHLKRDGDHNWGLPRFLRRQLAYSGCVHALHARASSARLIRPTPLHARLASTHRVAVQPFDDQGLAIAQAFAQHAVKRCANMRPRVNGRRCGQRAQHESTPLQTSAHSNSYSCCSAATSVLPDSAHNTTPPLSVACCGTAPCDVNTPLSDTAALLSPGAHRDERSTCDDIDVSGY